MRVGEIYLLVDALTAFMSQTQGSGVLRIRIICLSEPLANQFRNARKGLMCAKTNSATNTACSPYVRSKLTMARNIVCGAHLSAVTAKLSSSKTMQLLVTIVKGTHPAKNRRIDLFCAPSLRSKTLERCRQKPRLTRWWVNPPKARMHVSQHRSSQLMLLTAIGPFKRSLGALWGSVMKLLMMEGSEPVKSNL
jgi:hypothetical protein